MDLLKFQNDMENETLETAVNTWEKELNQKEKGSGYDLLTQIYGLKEVVCFLEKKYYGKEETLLPDGILPLLHELAGYQQAEKAGHSLCPVHAAHSPRR